MKHTIEYKVIQGSERYTVEFQRSVEKHLNTGWQLQGGVAMMSSHSNTTILYAQALVKESISQ